MQQYNKLLRDQLTDIDREIAQMVSSLRNQLQWTQTVPLTVDMALPLIEKQIVAAQTELYEANLGLTSLANAQELRRWLKARS